MTRHPVFPTPATLLSRASLRGAGVVGLLLTLASPALAAETQGFDGHGFKLTGFSTDPRALYTIDRPYTYEGQWYAGGLLEYANQPLVRVVNGEETTLLGNLVALNLQGGYAITKDIRVDLSAPIYLVANGDDADIAGAGFGDMRLTGTYAFLNPDFAEGTGAGVSAFLDLPTGPQDRFLGQEGVSGGGKALASYQTEIWSVSGELGVQFNPEIELSNLSGSDTAILAVGGGYLVSPDWGVNAETRFAIPFTASTEKGSAAPGELIFSGRHFTEEGGFLSFGAATGLTPGASAAAFRLFVGGGYGTLPPPKDLDGDGFIGASDKCPDKPETVNKYQDNDGCPDALARVVITARDEGAPVPDARIVAMMADGSSVKESNSSPLTLEVIPGTEWTAKATRGACLAGEKSVNVVEGENLVDVSLEPKLDARVDVEVVDKDGKRIPNAIVRWDATSGDCVPQSESQLAGGTGAMSVGKGTHRVFVTAEGYSTYIGSVTINAAGESKTIRAVLEVTKVKMEADRIVILDKVFFETGKDIIKPESFGLLDQVASTIISNPEAGLVKVEGHTDDKGNDASNLDLSKRRAESVKRYLISKGVPAERLVAAGYGETCFMVPNKTEKDRANNRRVEFYLVDQATPEVMGTCGLQQTKPAPAPAPEKRQLQMPK